MPLTTADALYAKIKSLNELLWEDRVTGPTLDAWLENFSGACLPEDTERRHALYLVSKFLYFGQAQVAELLRAMFRDLIRNPLSVEVRATLPDPDDFDAVHAGLLVELDRTRFLGLGNPSESGAHILYTFRGANDLPTRLFKSPADLVTRPPGEQEEKWAFPTVQRLIFIDDFCGTGSQAAGFGKATVPQLRQAASRAKKPSRSSLALPPTCFSQPMACSKPASP